MNTLSSAHDERDMLVEKLGGSEELDLTARATGAIIRARNVKNGEALLRLCLAYGPGGQSLRGSAAWAEATGLASLSNVALLKRLRKCQNWLEHLIGVALKDQGPDRSARGEESGKPDSKPIQRLIRLVDGSIVQKAGNEKGQWRIHSVYDLNDMRFSFFKLSDEKTAEFFDMAPVVPGEIRVGDRAYMQADRIGEVLDAGADILVRAGWNHGRWLDQQGEKFDLINALKVANKAGKNLIDQPIWVGRNSHKIPLSLRLVAIKKPSAAAEKSKRTARETAKRKGYTPSKKTLIAAEWMILITSLKKDEFSSDVLSKLYRLRWQIELAFKRLKSLIGTRQPPGKDEGLAKVFILSHLLLAILIEPSVAKLRATFP